MKRGNKENLTPRREAAMRLATWPISLVLHGAGLSLLLVVPLLRADAPPPLATPSNQPPPLIVVPPPPPGGGGGAPKPPPRSTERVIEKPPATDTLVAPVAVPEGIETVPDLLPDAEPCPDCLNLPGDPRSLDGRGGPGPGPIDGGGSGVGPMTTSQPVPVRAHVDVRPPEKVHNVAPVYPDMARRAGLEGIVIIECTIDLVGRVSNATVLRGLPFLSEAAIEAVQQWRYRPTLLNGVPVPVILTVTVNFELG